MRKDWIFIIVLFFMLAIFNTTSFLAAREAKNEAKRVRAALEQVNITSQNRCIVQVVLSYPPPVSQDQFDSVFQQYDNCIQKETSGR